MKTAIGEFLVGLLVLATVYVLVRPRSKGVQLVTAFGSMVTAITGAATDLSNAD